MHDKKLIELLEELLLVLAEYHEGKQTLRPFAQTWARDERLLERGRRILEDLEYGQSE